MQIKDIVIMIPALNPDEKFIGFLKELKASGYEKIIVINDGSRSDTMHYFQAAVEEYGCDLVMHGINLGQGRAYKSGFNNYLLKTGRGGAYTDTIGVIQCDCDGQHQVEDVNKCADLLRQNPNKFILGVRDFTGKNVPFRSRFGNQCTNFIFKVFCGLDIKDTQTGLKGIPASFIPRLMETPGERFEYASSVLLEPKKGGVEILQFPIKTIYINGNETSHFNPLLDSVRIYSLILRYLMASLSAFIVDIVAYSIFLTCFKTFIPTYYIILSTYTAKIVSCSYSFVVNKNLVFEKRSQGSSTAFRFLLLCVIQSSLSGFMTNGLVQAMNWNEVLSKIIIDILLFFVSFQVQNRWVFGGSNVSKN